MESVAPGERTFTRPSRRGADRDDIVLPGRRRESWMLNVVLDTSGSMTDEIPRVLGAVADFCDAVAVDQIRVVQCDTAVTVRRGSVAERTRRLSGQRLWRQRSRPAMLALADDPCVTACLIVTDGDIAYPARADALRRAVGAAVARQRAFPPALRARRHHAEGRAMKAVQELVAYFDRRGSAVAAPVAQAARPGLPGGGRAGDHDRPVRSGRRDVLFPGHAARLRARSGAPTSTPAIPAWRWPRSMPAW